MAKQYVKPTIAFQKLSTNTGLSAGCSMLSSFPEFSCAIEIPEWGETVFTESNCDWSNDDFYVCYHVPTAGSNVFSS
ncbi:MAG: hypothetical protein K6C36_09020 [Clostridia bacterium]|nr:hypothetical protein [Clostridia bacterium]